MIFKQRKVKKKAGMRRGEERGEEVR